MTTIEEVDAPTPVELPTGSLQLDEDNLPMSSFSTPALKLRDTSTPKTTVDLFKYSNPEIVSSDPLQECLEETPSKYTFKTPENTTVSKDVQCSDGWVKIQPEANNCTVSLTDISETDADWKCEDCWISNKSTVDKCALCGAARLGVKQNNPANVTYSKTSSFFGSSDDKSKTFIQSPKSNKWECSSCLVNDESDKDKCACCGAAKESKNETPKVEDPEATIAQKEEEVNTTIESNAKQQSGTNNVLAETPTFTFTLPTKQVDTKADDSKGQLTEAKINLTFVIPKAIPTDTDSKDPASFLMSVPVGIVFYFGENAQKVPSVDLNSLVTDNENRTLPPAVNSLNPLAADAVNSVPSRVVPDAEKPKPTFSFVVNAPKLNLLTQQTQSTTETTTSAPTLPLFKPPAATTVSNPSIPSCEAPSLTQPAAPEFNFDTPQSTSIFGFRQQAPLQQQQMQPAPLQSQLPAGRRLRKAFRRIPQRCNDVSYIACSTIWTGFSR
ncbi:nuclear pore complex protein Nup153-like isoform X2 [Helicoverpa zea]|nr:nuclear pore complex protein Nup153-like isoform X2 [Helicoverpa zea]XP_047040937.1 nuclear pore complex protein Nup153-like isoform X2 [Helicoverpa zea]